MAQILSKQQEALKNLEELLEHELGDYTFKWKIKFQEEYRDEFYFDVTYWMYDYEKADVITFKVNMIQERIYINKYNDIYEEIDIYEPSIKHLWMMVKFN